MLWWVSVAPFGKPVVPLVYWMLISSSKSSSTARRRSTSGEGTVSASSSHSGVPKNTARSSPGSSLEASCTIALKSAPFNSWTEKIQRQPDWPSAYCSSLSR